MRAGGEGGGEPPRGGAGPAAAPPRLGVGGAGVAEAREVGAPLTTRVFLARKPRRPRDVGKDHAVEIAAITGLLELVGAPPSPVCVVRVET
jgi:hypothetical protein